MVSFVLRGFHTFTDKIIQDFSMTPMKNFPEPFCSPQMFKYNVPVGDYKCK